MVALLCTIVGVGERTSLEKVGVGRRLPVDAIPRLFGLRDDDFVLFESRRVPRSSVEHGIEAAGLVDDGLIVDADTRELCDVLGDRTPIQDCPPVLRTEQGCVVDIEDINTADGFKLLLADGSWLLVRPSGTKPVLRVYAEAANEERIRELLEAGEELVEPLV